MQPKYKRVLLKLSGEALAGENNFGLDFDTVLKICREIKVCVDAGVEIAIVVGGGNFWRAAPATRWTDPRRPHGNAGHHNQRFGACGRIRALNCVVRVQTAIGMNQIAEPYIRNRAVRHLEKGRVVIFACGTGNPFFSTDTAAALRAAEIEADIILKASMVDGIFDSDPKQNANAVLFDSLSYLDLLNRGLKVMDSTAATLCRDNAIPILVFNLSDPKNIVRAINGDDIGTIVKEV